MTELFAKRIAHASESTQDLDYLKQLEAKRNFWGKVLHLSSDSERWEAITRYIQLMCDRRTSNAQLRASYKSLEKALTAQAKAQRYVGK